MLHPTMQRAPAGNSRLAIALSAAVVMGFVLAAGSSSVVVQKRKSRGQAQAAALTAGSASAPPSASALPAVSTTPSSAPPVSASAAPTTVAAPSHKLAIHNGTRVLVFGDSTVDAGFSQRLKKLVDERGATLVTDGWTSSSTKTWAQGDRLSVLLAGSKPDVVVVVLGANEVFLPAPEQAASNIRAIVKKIGDRPCVWVGPPLWKGETGIVGVERKNSAPCAFFDSGALTLERQPDGIHPNGKGGATWAEAFWSLHVE